ncbi:MAG: HEPN domain-containing protein [Bacteroidetes bacterium]|nr:HEPN domain-containing protein [Bacteroidota bacterium]
MRRWLHTRLREVIPPAGCGTAPQERQHGVAGGEAARNPRRCPGSLNTYPLYPRRLYANPRQESSWRIPTSRNEIDITPKTHSDLRNQFGLHFIKTGTLPEHLAEILNDAEDLRNLAEYAEERIITREDAEITLREAKEFVKRVGEFLNA